MYDDILQGRKHGVEEPVGAEKMRRSMRIWGDLINMEQLYAEFEELVEGQLVLVKTLDRQEVRLVLQIMQRVNKREGSMRNIVRNVLQSRLKNHARITF